MTVVATSTSRSPRRNASMVASFSSGFCRPCSNPSRRSASSTMLQSFEDRLGRCHLDLLRLVDQGAHDVDLPTVCDCRADVGPHRLQVQGCVSLQRSRSLDPVGQDRGSARWQLVEHRDVEVSVDGHRRRPRYRRGRHDEDVGQRIGRRLGPKRGSLLDAEAMLLVDHHDTEGREHDRVLDQRVGTDDEIGGAEQQFGRGSASAPRWRPGS